MADDDYVRVRWRACTALGLEDIRLSGSETEIAGANAVDPVDGAEYRIMIAGSDLCAINWFGDDDEMAYHDQDTLTFGAFMERVSDTAYWQAAFAALLELHTAAEEVIAEKARRFAEEQREELTRRLSNPALDVVGVEEALERFNTACEFRRQSSGFFEITLPSDDTGGFKLRFGHHAGQRNEVVYAICSGWKYEASTICLNGVRTTSEQFHEDIQRQCADPWERIGLLRAAQDLISIREASYDLVMARSNAERCQIDAESAKDRFEKRAAAVLHKDSLPMEEL